MVGTHLRDHALPDGAAIAFVVRDSRTFVPDDSSTLLPNDVLFVVVAPDTSPESVVSWATVEQ